jgi:hypothetical protein
VLGGLLRYQGKEERKKEKKKKVKERRRRTRRRRRRGELPAVVANGTQKGGRRKHAPRS